jgi:transcriptional accessory protein Tex/SPT6
LDSINARIANELKVQPTQVAAAVDLLDEGATVPFIARYRKEKRLFPKCAFIAFAPGFLAPQSCVRLLASGCAPLTADANSAPWLVPGKRPQMCFS